MNSHFPMRWAYYLSASRFWADLFSSLLTAKTQTVLEIGSGWAPKIPLALSQTLFTGEYEALDSSPEALENLVMFCADLPLTFSVTTRIASLFSFGEKKYDIVVLNHVLDDILLSSYLEKKKQHSLDELYSNRDLYVQFWEDIAKQDQATIQEMMHKTAHTLTALLNPGGILILTQYPAYQDQLFAFTAATKTSMQFFLDLRSYIQERKQLQNISNRSEHLWKDWENPPFLPSECVLFLYPDRTTGGD